MQPHDDLVMVFFVTSFPFVGNFAAFFGLFET